MILKKIPFWLFFLLAVVQQQAFGQSSASHPICVTIPEIAILDIEPNNTAINLSLDAATESGAAVASRADASKWLNYTSAIAPNGASRACLLYTSPSPRDRTRSRMPSSA